VAEVWPEAAPVVLPLLEEVRDQRNVYRAAALAVPFAAWARAAAERALFRFVVRAAAGRGVARAGAEAGQVLVVAIEVTESQRAQQALHSTLSELESALAEKTVLLKEVHHRVKTTWR